MENEKTMSIHEIDQHIDKHEASGTAKGTAAFNLCSIYQKARPIVKFVRPFLFFKPKWQAVIDELVAAGDEACPVA